MLFQKNDSFFHEVVCVFLEEKTLQNFLLNSFTELTNISYFNNTRLTYFQTMKICVGFESSHRMLNKGECCFNISKHGKEKECLGQYIGLAHNNVQIEYQIKNSEMKVLSAIYLFQYCH